MLRITDKVLISFWEKINVPENYEEDCWEWNRAINERGYVNFIIRKLGGKYVC